MTPDANLQPAYYVSGDVEIDGEVAIAPGAILTAEPGSRLIIAQGACLGSEVVIHVRQSDLIIEPEANLGSGVLIVGWGRIGAQACIGAGSTLINPQVSPRSVVAPRSLVGDYSRSSAARPESPGAADAPALTELSDQGNTNGAAPVTETLEAQTATAPSSQSNGHNNGHSNSHSNSQNNGQNNGQNSSGTGLPYIYGREQVQLLLDTLFPQRQALGTSSPRSE
ncbi:MAG: carbon dioxide concentrating mechanism protein [Cyanobacteria bacterium Co-bin13]|nr:carbon dioxide concentrating mechanism protein [Cyanobacteria bacterium Co-bin13]